MNIHEEPIQHLVVLGHPGPDSFNHAIAQTYCETVRQSGQKAVLRDLYAMDFDPRLKTDERLDGKTVDPAHDALAEYDLLCGSDVLTFVYPIWFGMPPAIIKGYVDRVLGIGFHASDLHAAPSHSRLQGKRLMILSSSASTRPWLEAKGQWLALRQAFEVYLQAVFGFRDARHIHFDAVVEGMPRRYVDECREHAREAARELCAVLLYDRRHLPVEGLHSTLV